jgi:hypothetical protein
MKPFHTINGASGSPKVSAVFLGPAVRSFLQTRTSVLFYQEQCYAEGSYNIYPIFVPNRFKTYKFGQEFLKAFTGLTTYAQSTLWKKNTVLVVMNSDSILACKYADHIGFWYDCKINIYKTPHLAIFAQMQNMNPPLAAEKRISTLQFGLKGSQTRIELDLQNYEKLEKLEKTFPGTLSALCKYPQVQDFFKRAQELIQAKDNFITSMIKVQ